MTVDVPEVAEIGVTPLPSTTAEEGPEAVTGKGVVTTAGASANLCAQLTQAYLLFPAAAGFLKNLNSFSSLKVSLRPLYAKVRGERGTPG